MTKFYDQDADEDEAECLGPEGDCTDTYNDPRCPVHGGMEGRVLPDRRKMQVPLLAPEIDRRSTARRKADRSIIADQAETIRALEGQLALARQQSATRLKALDLALALLDTEEG